MVTKGSAGNVKPYPQPTGRDLSPRERELVELVSHALESWPNLRWLVLPGPTDLARSLAEHLARELSASESREEGPPRRRKPRQQLEGILTPPCDHYRAFIGTVTAGDYRTGPHCSVSTCGPCAGRSAGFVELMTGEPAEPLLTFRDARLQTYRDRCTAA